MPGTRDDGRGPGMKRRSFLALTGLGLTGWRPRTDTADEPPWWRDLEGSADYDRLGASPNAFAMILSWPRTGAAGCTIDFLDWDEPLSRPLRVADVTAKTFVDIVGDVPYSVGISPIDLFEEGRSAVVIDFEDFASVKVYMQPAVPRADDAGACRIGKPSAGRRLRRRRRRSDGRI